MRFCKRLITGALLVLLTGAVARAEVKVVFECNRGADATAGFKFKNVPSPASNDAASKARFMLVDGLRDENGGNLRVLHDGRVPSEEDQPGRNFFFDQGQDGGRVAIDLRKVIEIKQVNTYSWHSDTRGPQVYKLYAADGSAAGFDARPKKGTDPAKCGWKFVVAVDTRPKSGEGGGQYGVSVSDSARAIGKYRYLLFDISATEKDDLFGNTFYSEIDVIDAAGPKLTEATAVPVARLVSEVARFGPVPDHHRLHRRAGAQGLGGEETPAHGGRVVSEDHRGPAEQELQGPGTCFDRHYRRLSRGSGHGRGPRRLQFGLVQGELWRRGPRCRSP